MNAPASHSSSSDAIPTRASHLPGGIIGRYCLVRQIGQGGMGTVWLAHDPVLDIDVALKLIHTSEVGSAAAHRLLREARAAAQIRHEGVVRVLDYGHSNDVAYLAMELLLGESFADMLDFEGHLDAERVLRMALPLLDALHSAHEVGIVHRDLKPENFFLSRDSVGRLLPKILDFGIAQSNLSPGTRLTRAGAVMGTPAFMAPEQVRGETNLDASTDLWAFTATLYEMLAGHLPFPDDDYAALLWGICNQEPPSLAGVRAIDDELWAVLRKGLAKDRSLRWGSARAYGEALAAWLLGRGVTEDISGASIRAVWFGQRSSMTSRPSLGFHPRPSQPTTPGGSASLPPRSTRPAPISLVSPVADAATPPPVAVGRSAQLPAAPCASAPVRSAALPVLDDAFFCEPVPPTEPAPDRSSVSQPAVALPSLSLPPSPPARRPLRTALLGAAAMLGLVALPWAARSEAVQAAPEPPPAVAVAPAASSVEPPTAELASPTEVADPALAVASAQPSEPPLPPKPLVSPRVEPPRVAYPSPVADHPRPSPPLLQRRPGKGNWF